MSCLSNRPTVESSRPDRSLICDYRPADTRVARPAFTGVDSVKAQAPDRVRLWLSHGGITPRSLLPQHVAPHALAG